MSRPPYPRSPKSTGREQSGDLARLDYLPLDYADLLALEEELAVTELGRPRTQGAAEEPDVTRTFMELSALVGHVLAVYQRQRAGEAFISTAQAPSSLVRHAHRLAYDPDPGLAATGHVVVFAKERVSGTVAAGLALASAALGELKAQDYETRDNLPIDSALNELLPADATRAVTIDAEATELRLSGTGHGLVPGDRVALVGAPWTGFVVTGGSEPPEQDVTLVALDRPVGAEIAVDAEAPPTLLAHPVLSLRPFGAAADPALFPPAALKTTSTTPPAAGTSGSWYEVTGGVGGTADIYLDRTVERPLTDEIVLRASGEDLAVGKVAADAPATVTFNRQTVVSYPRQKVTVTVSGSTFTTTTEPDTDGKQDVRNHHSGTVTAIQVARQDGVKLSRSDQPIPADWLTDWAVAAPLAATEPNPAELTIADALTLPGRLEQLTPGRPLVFSTLNEMVAQVVTVVSVTFGGLPGASTTSITWEPVTATPEGFAWQLNDLKVLGNVARVSHGRTVHETLGGSDGVTPFQRFALRESPVTVLPGVTGGEPEIEVRVDDVLWTRVPDFASSAPDDRHYRATTDEERVTTVIFGDGRNGAVPPSARRNIEAVYRVGLGEAGDVEPGRLSRLKRAHPLVDRVVNVTPVSGGTEPAGPEAVRSQATRWIRTFDRAVSVSDLADLALTMPGIARAAARWGPAGGAELVVATASGERPPALNTVRAFLDARRDVGVPLTLRGPTPRDVTIAVDLEPDPAFLLEAIKDAVREALYGERGMFTFAARGLGEPAYLSGLYERLEAVPGIVGVRVHEFWARDEGELSDVIPAEVDEWLRLQPAGLTLGVVR